MELSQTNEFPHILVGNLRDALWIVIQQQKDKEEKIGYTGPSAFLAGLQSNFNYLQNHRLDEGTVDLR
jgi:hypothetical protein